MTDKKIKIMYVDDLETEHIRFKKELESFEDFTLVGAFTRAEAALNFSLCSMPDLAVIDIEMPGKGGIWLASKLSELNVPFAFLTNYENYGVEAFKLEALHYFPKPITRESLSELIERYTKFKQGHDVKPIGSVYKEVPKRIFVNTQKQILILQLEDILYISAEGSYTKFHLGNGKEVLSGKNMKSYQSIVEKNPDFIKIHRSYIINQSQLESIDKKKLEMKFIFKNGIQIKMATFRRDEWLEKFL